MEKKVPISLDTVVDKEATKANNSKKEVRKIDLKYFGVKDAKSEQKVQQSGDELVLEQKTSTSALQEGVLKGVLECPKPQVCEAIGDSKDEVAPLTKDRLIQHIVAADPNYAQLKAILMQSGILQSSKRVALQFDKLAEQAVDSPQNEVVASDKKFGGSLLEELKYVLQWSSDANKAYLKELLVEKGLMESWVKESVVHSDREKPNETGEIDNTNTINAEENAKSSNDIMKNDQMQSPAEIVKIINDITQFTEKLEFEKSNNIDWPQLHTNLLKIHTFFLQHMDKTQPKEEGSEAKPNNLQNTIDVADSNLFEAIGRVELDIEDMMEPLNRLIDRSKSLTVNIKGIGNVISGIDHKIEQFYRNYYKTLRESEKSYKGMLGLQEMRKTIEKKLSQVEYEIFESKTRLMKRGVQFK